MKKLTTLSFFCVLWFGSVYSQGPPTEWKFYLAFEDATSAKDTIWIGLDSNGSVGELEPELGEVPVQLDPDEFNVWWYYTASLEAYKTIVYSIDFPPTPEIYAMNYVYPVTLSWDTTLFNAAVLQETEAGPICNPRMDNDWFFFQTNAPWLHHMYSMNYSDHVVLPFFDWGSQDHFPITVYFDRGHNCNPLSTEASAIAETLHLSPNPCNELLQLRSDAQLQDVAVYNLQGRKVLQQQGFAGGGKDMHIDVAALPPGMYLLHARDGQGRVGVKKFVKGE